MKTNTLYILLTSIFLGSCLTNYGSPTIQTGQTILPQAAASATLLPTVTSQPPLLIPDWASASPNVLLASFVDENFESSDVALINPETGEIFTVATAGYDAGYFWLSRNIIGLFDTSKRSVTAIHLETGAIDEYEIGLDQFEFATSGANFVTAPSPESPNFLILAPWSTLSPNGRFFLYPDETTYEQTGIYDLDNNSVITIAQPSGEGFQIGDGIGLSPKTDDSNFRNSWQPTSSGSFLALVSSSQEPQPFGFDVKPSFSLTLYNIESGTRIAKYEGITSVNWSPDANHLLYQPINQSEYGYFALHESAPCIFTISDGSTKCFQNVRPFHIKPGYQQLVIMSPDWTPDGSSISYIYFQYNNSLFPDYQDGGFCLIDVATGNIECPLSAVDHDETCGYQVPVAHLWSPDGAFVVIGHDGYGPRSDDGCGSGVVILNPRTREVFKVDGMVPWHDLGLWKPID